MYNIKFRPNSKNFRSRFKAHLQRCKGFYENGGTLHNSVDYFFTKGYVHNFGEPNLDVDFNMEHGVHYTMCERKTDD